MIVSDFTTNDIEYFRRSCNFVNFELEVFERRAKGESLEMIAEELNISYDYARKISQKVNKKILKVL
jgi:hypothetical protein